jgi:predicted MPP superfamily phosphohydrolase
VLHLFEGAGVEEIDLRELQRTVEKMRVRVVESGRGEFAGEVDYFGDLSNVRRDFRVGSDGGDFVSLEARYIEPLAQALGQVPAPYGRFAVLGNHDLWADDYPIRRYLSRAGIQVLVNRHAQLPPPFDHIWICGLDDPTSGAPDAEQTFCGADGVRVVLMHSPEGLAFIEQQRFDIALCGHNHGGQIALPNGRALRLPHGRFNRKYVAGHFQVGRSSQSRLIVSRGVGYGGLPIRLFAPPDVVICTLHS